MSAVRPGYKQTEVGVIPEEWEPLKLAAAASRSANAIVGGPFGSDLVSADYSTAGVPVIRGQNMGQKYVGGDFVFVTDEKAKQLSANCASASDLIFTQRGTLGQVAICPPQDHEKYLISQSQMKIALDRLNYDPEYFYYYFSSPAGQKQIFDSAIQTGVPHTNLGILRQYQLPVPRKKDEQRTIAEALGDADALIEALEALIAKKRDVKQGAMQDLLTGHRRLPGFQRKWEVKRLGECASFFKGKGLPKSVISTTGAFPCIHYGELFTFYGMTIKEVASRTNACTDVFFSRADDVLMPTSDVTPRGLAKASCLLLGGVVLGGDTLVIRPDPSHLVGSFLAGQVRYRDEQVLKLVTGSTVFHLYASDMRKFEFPLPSVDEQRAIASVLSDMDAEIAALEDKLTKARAVKQGMMQVLLTGEIRLV